MMAGVLRIVAGLRAVCLAGLLLGALPALAADGGSRAAAPVPLLWKVSAAGQSVWLLGSFHMLTPDDYPLSDDVDAAFADAARLVFELAPDEANSPALQLDMVRAATRADGSRLQDDLDAATWRKLETWAAGNGLSLAALDGFKPWFVGLTVSIVDMNRQGLQSELGLDRHFMDAAQRAGKPVSGLERARDQIAMLDGMDATEQSQMLAEALDQQGPGGEETRQLHAAWRRGDVERLWSDMALRMKREYPGLYRRINVERNDRWLPGIERRLHDRQGDTLVIVGALHLLGPDGVVEKLRRKGYAVQRVCSACAVSP